MAKVRRLRPAMTVVATAVVALLTACAAHAAGPPAGGGAEPHGAEPAFVPGELIVRYRPGVSAAERAAVRADEDADLQRSLPVRGLEVVKLATGDSVRATAADFEDDPDVLYAEPNFYYELDAIPDDPRFPELWGLHNTGQVVDGVAGTADADIDAPEAWETTTGSSSVTVGVVDSGVAFDHPDLAPNLWTNAREVIGNGIDDDNNGITDDWRGWDFLDENDSPRDLNGHGTHVAGTIAARGDDGAGVAGVSWNSKLMPLRACNAKGQCASDDVVAALAYAAANGARVVNASFGSANFSQAQLDVINAHPGTLFVAAAGNEGLNLDAAGVNRYPCEQPADNVICVAATDQSDALASFSNYGATAVDLAAPGVNVLSTLAAPDTVFGEGFESDIAARWTTTGTWARTNERAKTGSFSLTDSPGGNYQNNTDSFARPTNAFSLVGRMDCALVYQMRLAAQQNDGLIVGRSTNLTSWTGLAGWSGSTNGAFVAQENSLAAVSGESNVYVRFRMISDAATADDGAHLDDVQVLCPTTTYDTGDYAFLDGTSMATPHVTGTVALMWADTPGVSVAKLRERLLANVDAKPSLAGKTVTGGRLNAANAVESAPPPVVATEQATPVTRTGARLNGTVDPRGHATSYRFDYGTTTNYGNSTPVRDAGSGDGVIAVSAGLPLAAGTTYHYRLVATYADGSSDGVVAGDDAQFTTPHLRPEVGSQPASAITSTTATVSGTVDPRGLATTYHFEYGPTESYGTSTPTVSAGSGSGAVPVSAALSDLTPATTYHFRLVATNEDGTTATGDDQFTTQGPPAVTLEPPTAITHTGATLNGTVDARGKATTYHFEYGPTTTYGSSTPEANAAAGSGAQPVSAALRNLAPETTYHYRLVAASADGTTHSADATFTTLARPPALQPQPGSTGGGSASPPVVEPFTIVTPATLRLDRRGAVRIRLGFPLSTPAGTGRVEILRGRPRSDAPVYAAAAGAPKRIATRSFATRPGATVRVRIRLTRAGRRLVARRRSVNATVRVTVATQVQAKRVRLRARRR